MILHDTTEFTYSRTDVESIGTLHKSFTGKRKRGRLHHFTVFGILMHSSLAAAVAIATINSWGNLGGFVGPYIFGYLRTVTGHYESALWFAASCMLLSGLLATRISFERLNKSDETA